MGKTFGIDLGTTYSVIATLDENGMPVVIENFNESKSTLASAVYFPEGDERIVVGEEAKNSAEIEPGRVVQLVKRYIGKSDAPTYEFNGKSYNPITISALILKRLAEYAAEQGHDVKDVVITCPAYFGIEERNATRQAGEAAGFNVLNILNEPTAAAINYCSREYKENRTIMVYDLGGGTFDVTIIRMTVDENGAAVIDIVETDGNDRLGGADWDKLLFDHMLLAYCEQNGINPDDAEEGLRQTIRSKVELTKMQLSQVPSKRVSIIYDGETTRVEVTKEQFEAITRDKVAEAMGFVDRILMKTGLNENDIDVVLLVGGSTLMPMIFDTVSARFPGKIRREDPNLAVAKGAALSAAIIMQEIISKKEPGQGPAPEPGEPGTDTPPIVGPLGPGIIFHDRTPRSFGPGVLNKTNEYVADNLILIGEPSPAEASKVYYTPVDNMARIILRVFENVSSDPDNRELTPCVDAHGDEQYTDPALKMKLLGQLELPLPPMTPQNTPVEVTFRLDTSGLFVKAVNQATGESVDAKLKSENTLSDEQMAEIKRDLGAVRTTSEA